MIAIIGQVGLNLDSRLAVLPVLVYRTIALVLTLFIPKGFTAIAFDAGGATGGSLTTTFLLPIAIGTCYAVGGNIFTDAFGLASMVSLIPIITVELVGVLYQMKTQIITNMEMLLRIILIQFGKK